MFNFQNAFIHVQIVIANIRIVEDWQDTLNMNVEWNGNFHV